MWEHRKMTTRTFPDRFLIAITFSGNERNIVEPLANALEQRLGPGTVFYDSWYEHYIAGEGADARLQDVYAKLSELVIVGISGSYGAKLWTLTEHEAVRARSMQLRASIDGRDKFRILPLRVGDGDVPGDFVSTVAPDIRGRPLKDTVELVLNRLRLIRPDVLPTNNQEKKIEGEHFIFLAESTPDLDDPTRPVNRRSVRTLLEGLGWRVLPASEYEDATYAGDLLRDLSVSKAFVQLLGPYPWKRGGYDRLQFDAAVSAGLRRFVYRSNEIDLSRIESEAHRQLLARPDVVASSFDDFLVYLERQIGSPAVEVLKRTPNSTDPPLVRIAIRSENPEVLWERVFPWFYAQELLLWEQLAPDESFELRQRLSPCQGFVIICDACAMLDGPLSPRHNMSECRLIQIREKDPERRPPVALVYWPPPEASWPRLLRSVPLKLHYAQACEDAQPPSELRSFFEEVRQVLS
jgi:hypothetical protein